MTLSLRIAYNLHASAKARFERAVASNDDDAIERANDDLVRADERLSALGV